MILNFKVSLEEKMGVQLDAEFTSALVVCFLPAWDDVYARVESQTT